MKKYIGDVRTDDQRSACGDRIRLGAICAPMMALSKRRGDCLPVAEHEQSDSRHPNDRGPNHAVVGEPVAESKRPSDHGRKDDPDFEPGVAVQEGQEGEGDWKQETVDGAKTGRSDSRKIPVESALFPGGPPHIAILLHILALGDTRRGA